MARITDWVKSNPRIKRIVHWMIVPKNEARPRIWIRLLVNPFFHNKQKGSRIRRRTRMDVLPFNKFQLGKFSTIEDFSTINNGVGDVIIGDHTLVGMSNVIIGPVEIGSNVIIAQNVVMSGLNHNYQDVEIPIVNQNVSTAKITIKDESWIAANVVITAGVTIGRHAVVAAGSVVTKDVPDYTVAAGNPAKVLKKYDNASKSWIRIKNGDIFQ